MCGIAGTWGAVAADVDAMLRALHHRGPDDRGLYSDELVTLAMTRLAIQDPSPAGHQPMSAIDGQVWIVFNGEVYNFREERARLVEQAHAFHSGTDTEIVLTLYLMHGDNFVQRLRGMFALAIYDRRGGRGKERLLLARDHFGIKPLLYAELSNGLLFGSELKAMLASGVVESELDPAGLWQLLAHGAVRQPRTMLNAVRMLPPAHRLVVDRTGLRLERYWSLGAGRVQGLTREPYPNIVKIVGQTLRDSAIAQLVADVPVGAFLSGGIDSSLLVGFLARQHSGPVRTFSVGFAGEGAALDETDFAADVAAWLGTNHSRIEVTGADVRDHVERIAGALDQPTVDGVNSYFISRFAATQLKVAISGTGSDELFAGYPWFATMRSYAAAARGRVLRNWLVEVRASAARGADRHRLPRILVGKLLAYRESGFLGAFAQQYRVFGGELTDCVMPPNIRGRVSGARSEAVNAEAGDELPDAGPLERTSALVLRGYTQNQLLRDIDAASMAHSLEVRVPFLDPVVADLALSLPEDAKLASDPGGGPADSYRASGIKRVLLDIARPVLPPGFDARPKRGFGMPFGPWLRGPLSEVLHDCLSPQSIRARGWLDADAVGGLLQRFEAGQEDWPRPWLLMMVELWGREVLDKTAAGSVSHPPHVGSLDRPKAVHARSET